MPAPQKTKEAKVEEKVASNVNRVSSEKIEPEKILISWRAPARPFKKRDKQYWTTIIAAASVFGLILFLVEGAMPVLLIISLLFLFYVLSTVEPGEIDYHITNKGIKVADSLTEWEVLTRFWFTRRLTDQVLAFEMNVIPGRLEVVIKPNDKEVIRKVLKKYLTEEEAAPSNIEKVANWASEKLPGNK